MSLSQTISHPLGPRIVRQVITVMLIALSSTSKKRGAGGPPTEHASRVLAIPERRITMVLRAVANDLVHRNCSGIASRPPPSFSPTRTSVRLGNKSQLVVSSLYRGSDGQRMTSWATGFGWQENGLEVWSMYQRYQIVKAQREIIIMSEQSLLESVHTLKHNVQ